MRIAFWQIVLLVAVIGGCSAQPQISKANVKLVAKLRTAVAAKKPDWLNSAAKQIDEQHRDGKLSEDEYKALEPIVSDARQGHWSEANDQMARLIDGQRGG